jgi:hypothetical protein
MATDFDNFVAFAAEYAREYKDQRPGQAFFNALYEKNPHVANLVQQADLDPFYRDENLASAWEFVMDNWPQPEEETVV